MLRELAKQDKTMESDDSDKVIVREKPAPITLMIDDDVFNVIKVGSHAYN